MVLLFFCFVPKNENIFWYVKILLKYLKRPIYLTYLTIIQ